MDNLALWLLGAGVHFFGAEVRGIHQAPPRSRPAALLCTQILVHQDPEHPFDDAYMLPAPMLYNSLSCRLGVGSVAGACPPPGDYPWRWTFCGWGVWTGTSPQTMVVSDAREDAR